MSPGTQQVELGEGVRRAIVSENLFAGTLRITNRSKGRVAIHGNVAEREG